MNRLDMNRERLEDIKIFLSRVISDTSDTDMAEVDGMTVPELRPFLQANWPTIKGKLPRMQQSMLPSMWPYHGSIGPKLAEDWNISEIWLSAHLSHGAAVRSTVWADVSVDFWSSERR